MTTTQITAPAEQRVTPGGRTTAGLGLGGAALAVAAVVVMGDPLRGATSGAMVTDRLATDGGPILLAAVLAGVSAAALAVAAMGLGARAGAYGRSLALGGVLSSVLLATYFAAFGGGVLVVTQVLDDVGPGVGEATLVAANLVSLVRYTGAVLLLGAAVAGLRRSSPRSGRGLPRWVGWSALVLLVLLLVPMTGWLVAGVVLPVWLGVVAAAAGLRER